MELTEEQYIEQKKNKSVSLEGAWEVYINTPHDKPKVDFNTFIQVFQQYCIIFNPQLPNYWEYFDKKFKINNEKNV